MGLGTGLDVVENRKKFLTLPQIELRQVQVAESHFIV
jgi:hypothetical protein